MRLPAAAAVLLLVTATGCAPSHSGCVIESNDLSPTPAPVGVPPAFGQYQGKRAATAGPQPQITVNLPQIRC